MPKTILEPESNPNLNHLKKEYTQRLRLASMSDTQLYDQTLEALEISYSEREYPYDPSHHLVDLIREEWDRRSKPHLFSKAFRQL